MKKIIAAVWVILAATLLPLRAQNNPYDIDDECYALFMEAEQMEGKFGFEKSASNLLKAAIAKEDTKAQTLYYVVRLKNETALRKHQRVISEKDDEEVLGAMESLKNISMTLGFPQYYYYAYELVQNYYYSHGQKSLAMRLLEEAHDYAIKHKDKFGVWYTSRYLVALYREREDYLTCKTYVLQALAQYNNTDDPIIKRQSPCRLYCDLSDTYPVGSDSMYLCIDKAAATAVLHMDSLRVGFYRAVQCALQKDTTGYKNYSAYCKNDASFERLRACRPAFFESIDRLISGKPVDPSQVVDTLISSRNVKFLANIAEIYGNGDLAFELEKRLVNRLDGNLSKVGMANLAEMNAHLGNLALHETIVEQEREQARSTTIIRIVVIALLVIALLGLTLQLLQTRKKKKRDEEMIATLQEANEKVRLADAAKTRFVQNMSHEVRTPLNAIVGFSQLLSLPDGSFPEEEKEEFASHIVNNTKMLTMLLDDILNASAMDSGGYRITYEQGEMNYMAEAAISSAEHRLQPGVVMKFAPEHTEPFTFTTDPRRVQQILINLLTNACKHTETGEITLSCSLSANPGFVTYAVTDTGCGVPADQAEAIFERFTKLNDFVQGTGLGLSICREIATKMGGRVFLDTSYTDGARFCLVLPLEPPKTQTDD